MGIIKPLTQEAVKQEKVKREPRNRKHPIGEDETGTFDRNYVVGADRVYLHEYRGYMSYSTFYGDFLGGPVTLTEYRTADTEAYEDGVRQEIAYDIAGDPTGIIEVPIIKHRRVNTTPPPARMGTPLKAGDKVTMSGRAGTFTLVEVTDYRYVLEDLSGARIIGAWSRGTVLSRA